MVNTEDILKHQAETDAQAAAKSVQSEEKLDDVMLAMDVVDTLRHEHMMIEKDLAVEDRRQALIERLRSIYKAQGINVPDEVLMDGVMALEEQRFVYEPPKKGFSTSLARFYINRKKWLPLLYTVFFVSGAAYCINYLGFERPQKVESKRIEKLLGETLPTQLNESQAEALKLAATDDLKARINDLHGLGETAISEKNIKAAEKYTADLKQLSSDLSQRYTLRIVSRPNEYSGVFRINDEGGTEVRNYYLIVEGVTPSGELAKVLINSEEDQKSRRTNIWGVRVPQSVFNRVAADKQDDQIIQNATIGEKKRGYLSPEYSIETSGGLILDW